MNELSQAISHLHQSATGSDEPTDAATVLSGPSRKEMCPSHKGTPLSYYCVTCSKPICSDCAMFGSDHRSHQFEHLKDVYDRHLKTIREESTGLRTRLAELNECVSDVQ